MEDVQLLTKKKSWYKRWWGILVLIFVGFMLLFTPLFLYQSYKIYTAMKSGTYVPTDIVKEKAPYDIARLIDSFSPTLGNKDAKIKIVEFGDFNCPNTLIAYPIVKQMLAENKDNVEFYWRNYPVTKASSLDFAKAGVCADKQGKFWPLHDRLFDLQGKVTVGNLQDIYTSVGLDAEKMTDCLASPLTLAQIRKDYYASVDGAVRGTPTFFINGFKIEGPLELTMWNDFISKFLQVYGQNK